ncbi:MAG: HAMP domain-containing histidine kinase [Lachnospiraceae bacterium]|nr:HAMP domain-containing histidine kinase [Lachnospiraceae bacterium]
MNAARKKFIRFAMLSVFILLLVILGIINGMNFTMAAADADIITEQLSRNKGSFENVKPLEPGSAFSGKMGPMGPDSPELSFTTRYFTVRFEKDGEAKLKAFQIAAISEEEAIEWASELKNGTTGWTRGTYRFRVYTQEGKTFVTVIDQGRELLPSYRILYISLGGIVLGLLVSFFFLNYVGKRVFAPLEEADRKQKQFLREAEKEFKVPLTVINADAELIERENGPSDYTTSIHRQVKHMTGLVRQLGSMAIFEEATEAESCPVSQILTKAAESRREDLAARNITLSFMIEPDVTAVADGALLERIFGELMENAVKFAEGDVLISLKKNEDRIQITASNATSLTDGDRNNAFDRFTRFENAEGKPGSGLGLSMVKSAVKEMDGRVSAKVEEGQFVVHIAL